MGAHKDRLWDRQNGKCFYCGVAMSRKGFKTKHPPSNLATKDHYLPRHILTPEIIELLMNDNRHNTNLILSCYSCNQEKADKVPLDWDGYVGEYQWVSGKWWVNDQSVISS